MLSTASLLAGEWSSLHLSAVSLRSTVAFAYLIFVSISGAIAYAWLLRVTSPARVATHAYVNPAVAVLLGWVLAHERIDPQTLLAFGLIAAAVFATITAEHGRKRSAADAIAA
jgi:drug/metabolite transporter (DMT)-like permease